MAAQHPHHLPPKPVLSPPLMPTIQTSRPSDEHGDRHQILLHHQQQSQSSSLPHSTSTSPPPAPPLFTGSSALGGTDLNDDEDEDEFVSIDGQSLAPPHLSGNRRSPSPRATSPSVGTIGGHRGGGGGGSAHQSQRLDRQPSEESLTFQSIRSTSPAGSFHAFRSMSPGFMGAMTGGRMSPMRAGNDRHHQAPSLYQVMGEQRAVEQQQQQQQQQRASMFAAESQFRTASPAASDRPASRLDFNRLQQRQNSANSKSSQQPTLVQPRPEMPPRTFSESSSAAGVPGPASDHGHGQGQGLQGLPQGVQGLPHGMGLDPNLLASLGAMGMTAGAAGMGMKSPPDAPGLPVGTSRSPEGYPFPNPRMAGGGLGAPRVDSPVQLGPGTGGLGQQAGQQQHNQYVQHQSQQQPQQPFNQHHQQQAQRHKPQAQAYPSQRNQQQQPHPAQHSHAPPEQRLTNVEAALEELNKGLTSVAHSVGWLIEREKERERKGSQGSSRGGSRSVSAGGQFGAASDTSRVSPRSDEQGEELRVLGQQVSILSSSVQQLMQLQQQQVQQGQGGTRQQQQQTLPPTATPHALPPFGAVAPSALSPSLAAPFPPQQFSKDGATSPLRGPSPRPIANVNQQRQGWSGSPRPDSRQDNRRWSHLPPPGAVDVMAANNNGRRTSDASPNATATGGPSAVVGPDGSTVAVTKWEHLGLQPDLLRAVLKYGLGPPNKIQQRALPFLLRGSDIIAQAPPTQERIASYVIPALQVVLTALRGGAGDSLSPPLVLMISTTVDQATQAQRMALGLGSALGVRVHIAAAASVDAMSEAQAILQQRPHIVVGTPAKMTEVVTHLVAATATTAQNSSGISVRMVVLDEVDQMIARNLSDHVGTLLRALPSSVSTAGAERQTCIFSNTVPQDVLNFAQSIHLRESVRVLVRREGTSVTQHPARAGAGAGSSVGGGGANASNNNHVVPNPIQSGFVNGHGNSSNMNNAHAVANAAAGALRLRQYYLYIAISDTRPMPTSSGFSSTGGEMKLDVIADLLEDMDFNHAVLYTGSSGALEAVTYKLASRGIEALALHRDMALHTRQAVMAKFRAPASGAATRKALVAYDVAVNPREVHQIPLVVFYDLPRGIEEYKDKVACAGAGGAGNSMMAASRPSVCINVVSGGGGGGNAGSGMRDIDVIRALEAGLGGAKMQELPIDARGLLNE